MRHLKRFWKWLCKTKTSTVALVFAIAYSLAFTVAIFVFSALGITLPGELIVCVYSECAVIGLTSGAITISRIRVGDVEVELEQSEVSEDD